MTATRGQEDLHQGPRFAMSAPCRESLSVVKQRAPARVVEASDPLTGKRPRTSTEGLKAARTTPGVATPKPVQGMEIKVGESGSTMGQTGPIPGRRGVCGRCLDRHMSAGTIPSEQPTPVGLLDAVRAAKAAELAAQVDQLRLVVEWCVAHEVDPEDAATVTEFGRDTGLALAGEGAPCVSEFAVVELAAAVGMTTDAAKRASGRCWRSATGCPGSGKRLCPAGLPGGGRPGSPNTPAPCRRRERGSSMRG